MTLDGVSGTPGQPHRIQRRPKDRKAQITRAAAEAFSAYGYHAASMEAIAAKVGISAPALYRHYPNKYAMFASTVRAFGQQFVDCTDFVDAVSDTELAADPGAVLDRVVDALIDVALRNRGSGGLYRWETRYLNAEDQAALTDRMRVVSRRIRRPLVVIRAGRSEERRCMLSAGLFSVIASIIDHELQLPDDEIRAVLTGAASALLTADLPEPGAHKVRRPSVWRVFSADAGAYEALLHGAMVLFGNQGYAETSVTQIAEAVGIPVSGIYRYFSSKGDILTTGLRRAADWVSGELSAISGVFTEPSQVLTHLAEAYVATFFANPELSSVYCAERVNLAPADQELLRNLERSTIDSWVQLVASLRPELGAIQARFLVHAAVALVADLDRMVHDGRCAEDPAAVGVGYVQACVQKLMERVLFGSAV